MKSRVLFARPRMWFAKAVVVLLALFVSLFSAQSAYADQEAVTRSIGGVNYTLPADWVETEIPAELTDEALTESIGFGITPTVVAYSKYDGLFAAMHIPTPAGDYVSLEEFDEMASMLNSTLRGTPFDSIVIASQIEQNCPTLTVYTDDIVFNDIAYALTIKLFAVDTGSTSDAVFMVSFLPADGVLHEDVMELLPYSDEPQTFTLADVVYELPGGSTLAEGSLFGINFMLAYGDDAGLYGFELPMLADDGLITASDLQDVASELISELELQLEAQGVDSFVSNLWMGGYDFIGFPTLGLEFLVDAGDGIALYFCTTANITPSGTAFLILGQSATSDFASYLLTNAAAVDRSEDALPPSAASATQSDSVQDELGFVIGVQ